MGKSRVRVHPVRGSVEAVVEAPPSKSYTHRALLAAAYAGGETIVRNPLVSSDTLATVSLVRALGARVTSGGEGGQVLAVRSRGIGVRKPWCYCRGSGTTLRLGMGAAALGDRVFTLYGNPSLNRRPVEPLAHALRGLGVEVLSSGGSPPVAVKGPVREGVREAVVEGGVSSQFVSSLLMLGARVGFSTRVRGGLRSRPYVDLTLRVLREFGVEYRVSPEQGGEMVFTPGGAMVSPGVFSVPGDYSSAAFLLAVGALVGRVRVTGLRGDDVQGDRFIVELLHRMGARVRSSDSWVEASRGGGFEALDVFMGDTPDLVPVVSVLASYARGVSRLRGVGHLRYKESDRLSNIVENLGRLGVEAWVEGETLAIRGRGRLGGGVVVSRCDHRIVMSFAVGALVAEAPVEITCPGSVAESFPGFFNVLESMGARVEWG